MTAQFVVENAGCPSCGERVRLALADLGAVDVLDIDEEADVATVRLASTRPVSPEEVSPILESASEGSGHVYRVQPDSWTARTVR